MLTIDPTDLCRLKEQRANLLYLLSLSNLTQESRSLFESQLAIAESRIRELEPKP